MKSKSAQIVQKETKHQTSKGDEKTKLGMTKNFRGLLGNELKSIYWAEKAFTKAFPKMIKKASSHELIDIIKIHLSVTNGQMKRLEKVFSIIGIKAIAKKCEAISGLIKEGGEIIEQTERGVICDTAIILSIQKLEHYEIATYGALCMLAKVLEENEAASLLEETLNEEKEVDDILSKIAETINTNTSDEDSDFDEDEKEEIQQEVEYSY